MKYLYGLTIALFSIYSTSAQDSTIRYFDAYMLPVDKGEPFQYYRIDKHYPDHIEVTTFYKSGAIKMKGTRAPYNEDGHWVNEQIHYYEDGTVSNSVHYRKHKKDGLELAYFPDGSIKSKTNYKHGLKNGTDSNFYTNGQIVEANTYVNDSLDGNVFIYHENGTLDEATFYKNGIQSDTQLYYSTNGVLIRKEVFENKERIQAQCYDSLGNEIAFTERRVKPTFKFNFNQFLGSNLRYPSEASEYGHSGKVHIQFVINEDGKISDITYFNLSVHPSLAKEAIRVLLKSDGMWNPGKVEGVAKRFKFVQPISFTIQ